MSAVIREALERAEEALGIAASRFNMMGGVLLVNGADPRAGYREAYAAARDARVALEAIPSEGTVKVRALDWVKHPAAEMWRAETEFGLYQVAAVSQPSWSFDGVLLSTGINKSGGVAATAEEAKAAAQADYERRVLACFAAPTLSGEAEAMPVGEAVATWEMQNALGVAATLERCEVWVNEKDAKASPRMSGPEMARYIREAIAARPAEAALAETREENARLQTAMLVFGAYLLEKSEAFRTGEGAELVDAYSAALTGDAQEAAR